MTGLIAQATRIGAPVLGIVIPGIVFIVSFILTWLLYRHFSKHH